MNPEKVRSDLKEKVIRYQEECFEALYNYWHFGKAERSQNPQPNYRLRKCKLTKKRCRLSLISITVCEKPTSLLCWHTMSIIVG
nr:phage antirepressor N-terminal domain-containing protein [Rodentibacter pneumotropicus]